MRTSKKEVSVSAYRAMELKLAKSKETTKQLRSEGRYLRKRLKSVEASRAAWRTKAVDRQKAYKSLERRYLRRRSCSHARGHQYPSWLVSLVVVLRIYCHCSYGSIRKVVQVLQTDYMQQRVGVLEKVHLPSEQTLQNWVSKVGFFYLQQTEDVFFRQELCLIIDESVRVGTEKLLLVLACPIEKLQQGHLSRKEVRVVGLCGSTSWKGEQIAQLLTKIIAEQQLKVSYILSDEGNNLVKAARLLHLPHLPDISHLLATCLRKTFEQHEDYKAFCNALVRCQSKLAMGPYCYLRPPKQRAKGRFLNQQKVVNWAMTVLNKWEEVDEQARQKLEPIRTHTAIIEALKACIDFAKQTASMLKTNGLNQSNIQSLLQQIKQQLDAPQQCPLQATFLKYLKSYLLDYQSFIQQKSFVGKTIQPCSDVIERLLGMYKAKLSDNYFVTTSTLGLELPLMCINRKTVISSVQNALETVTMANLKQWRQEQTPDNQTYKRATFFKK